MEEPIKTKLAYFEDMWKLTSRAKFLSHFQGGDGRRALILNSTIFFPQGSGQPSDAGFISKSECDRIKFVVEDVRINNGKVYHYGRYEGNSGGGEFERGQEVCLFVDELRRHLNARLHTAAHLLDCCMWNMGLRQVEPGEGYHFPDGPYAVYEGTIPQTDWLKTRKELELKANELISNGAKVLTAIVSYEEAFQLCGCWLPEYISTDSTPRIVKLGDNIGYPCGGTHVADVAEIGSMKVLQICPKEGLLKVFYTIGDSRL